MVNGSNVGGDDGVGVVLIPPPRTAADDDDAVVRLLLLRGREAMICDANMPMIPDSIRTVVTGGRQCGIAHPII